jgi:short-chain fatty acids transporter
MIKYWGDGFWNLIPFTMQMAMVFLGGYVLAATPLVNGFLNGIACRVKTPGQAILITCFVSCTGCWLNWGFGLVVGGLLCRALGRTVPNVNFRLLVASAYSGFLVWHGGLSGSIPLTIATPGNFSEATIGRLIPVQETIFSTYNLLACALLFILLPILNWLVGANDTQNYTTYIKEEDVHEINAPKSSNVPADHLENSKLICLFAGGAGLLYVAFEFMEGNFKLQLNMLNFLFLFLALFLHKSPKTFIKSLEKGAGGVGAILLQFPFYAGIMGMMQGSGLAEVIAGAYVKFATPESFNVLTFYTSGLLNLFIPSGGGQWAVQAPVAIKAAQELGVDIAKTAMAVAWGDAWTNMIQPFWALPLLAIAGLKLRDIMGYCVMALFVSGVVLSAIFLIF